MSANDPTQDGKEQLRQYLQYAFPGAGAVDDATLEGASRALVQQSGPALASTTLAPLLANPAYSAPPAEEEIPAFLAPNNFPLYIGNATHHRVRSMTNTVLGSNSDVPFQSEFVGHLPMVRVPLPASFPSGSNPDIRTAIGNVYLSSDHLVGSLALIAEKFASQLGYSPARVDLLTPARTGITQSRFGAIAIYMGYKVATDTSPSFYLLEGGLATGQPMILYFGKTITTTIVQRSGYVPTAYSSASNFYTGQLVVQNNEPISLDVQVNPPGKSAYARISVDYVKTTTPSNDPFALLIEAAQRVALIGRTMGVSSGIPLEGLMADLALNLPWVVKPAYGGPGSLSTTEAPAEAQA